MKINSMSGGMNYTNSVREKAEGQSNGQGQGHGHDSQHQNSEQDNAAENQDFEQELKKIVTAVEQFQSDSQAQSSGLNASVEGTGPGLKVVLKDGNGGVLRRLSGEEFLRLRQSSAKDVRSSGKILDKKL